MIISLSMVMAMVSCSKDNDEPNVTGEKPAEYSIKLSAKQKLALNQNNNFAFDIMKAMNDENRNMFVSPYSIGQALAMLANGAEDETFDEIAHTLKIGDEVTLNDINSFYATMNKALTTDIKCSSKVAISNSLWLNKQFNDKIIAGFKDNVKTYFGAKVSALDFSDNKSFNIINNWSKNETSGLIPNIINVLNPKMDVAILLNTLYFKGFWSYFPTQHTHNDIFRNQFDRNENVKMMTSNKCLVNGFISDNELIAEFNYGGDAFQLLVIMPKKDKINDYIANFNGVRYSQLLANMEPSESEVSMPKFKCAFENELIGPLSKIGVKKVFSNNAQFGKISSELGMCVTNAQQYATIEVNEDGTTASASTKVDIGFTSAGKLPQKIIIDHPFIYIIKERTTGVILFVGKAQSIENAQ